MLNPVPPPPTFLPCGYKLIAGMGHSTVLADIDFETYSEAGCVWDVGDAKWKPLPNAKEKGLPAVGLAVYAEHPTTEVISLAYDLKDGKGRRLWLPSWAFLPQDLFDYINQGGLIEAWNASFEFWIWNKVCIHKYGFPPLPLHQIRCAAAKARAHALPGGLDNAGDVLNIINKKDKQGKQLIQLLSMPNNPTKKDPDLRRVYSTHRDLFKSFYEYNLRDIQAEAEISGLVPDLSPRELKIWQHDQLINYRGVQIDVEAVYDCIAIIEQAYARYNAELNEITGGAVEEATKLARLIEWMKAQGVHTRSLDEDHIADLLKKHLPNNVRRALEIRQLVGSASVKKLYAMLNQVSGQGRLHNLFVFHSARTGRAAGFGPQPQNLPSGGPVEEWDAVKMCEALEDIKSRSLDIVEKKWGNAVATVSGCLRGLFIASPGHDLICSDYKAIEAVVLAALAGEEWRLEVFRTHGLIYELSASKITGVPFGEFIRHVEETGKHHPLRKTVGKVAELACLGPDTQVLTKRGYIKIVNVKNNDELWDGEEWVKHGGLINKGVRKVINLDGLKITPNHPITLGNSWKEAGLLASNVSFLSQALEIGSQNLPFTKLSLMKMGVLRLFGFNARVMPPHIGWLSQTSIMVKLPAVINALKRKPLKVLNTIGNTLRSLKMMNIGGDYLIESQRLSPGVKNPHQNSMLTTGGVGYASTPPGLKTSGLFCHTWPHFLGGISRLLKWTVLTLTRVMNPVISDSLLNKKTIKIEDRCKISKTESKNLSTVYDIVNAGPRHRFTIKTNSGHLIVHNSGFSGWVGAWKAFGADEFFTEDEMKVAILAWRAASPKIVEFWGGQKPNMYGIEGAAVQAVMYPGKEFSHRGITYLTRGDILYCRLLSGKYLTYHRPRLKQSYDRPGTFQLSFESWNTNPKYGKIGWVRIETHRGKLTENIVQATAFEILATAMINLEDAGYKIVLHVHDEIVAEVPEGQGSIEEFERIMSQLPEWAKDWPLKATGGWRAKRYSK